jgi:DNA polymerase-2
MFLPRDQLEQAEALLQNTTGWRQAELPLKTFLNQPVNAFYFLSRRRAREFTQQLEAFDIPCWEADIKPPERFLMERYITAACTLGVAENASYVKTQKPSVNPRLSPADYRPSLKCLSIDIETSMDAESLYSIAVWGCGVAKVFMICDVVPEHSGEDDLDIVYCRNGRGCLLQFLICLDELDPDVLIGWNLVGFDLWVLESLCKTYKLDFTIGRGRQKPHWREDDSSNRRYVSIAGRVALDGIELLKAANYRFDSFSLESVSRELLGQGKLLSGSDRGGDISELFVTDKVQLARYNLKDCELVAEIFEQEKLLEFAIERSHLTGLLLDRIGGSVASFEYAYLPQLHRQGYVAPNLGELESDIVSPGGYVMDSAPGIYNNVLVLDFKSLYPSIIKTFLIDPLGFWAAEHQGEEGVDVVPGFNGAYFSKQTHILPAIINTLWEARDGAKKENNAPLSHAIKIIMNSFYGVLGSTGCRFYDPRVCSSITLRGHEIIQTSREWIEEQGLSVIYGDTDSLFVWLGDDPDAAEAEGVGKKLSLALNQRWTKKLAQEFGIQSALEIEFETHYLKFLMPTIRGSALGSKKRYAGTVQKGAEQVMVFKGLEVVRTDWTPLAKLFQMELFQRIFADQPFEDFVVSTAAAVLRGEMDERLIYRKRLRRKLEDYTKSAPPHVKAARKVRGKTLSRGDWVEYVITQSGPEPVAEQLSPINYQHYIDKQLMPVADSILNFKGVSFAEIVDKQLSLFSKLE